MIEVQILGVTYHIDVAVPFDADPEFQECSGYCKPYSRLIRVVDYNTVESWKNESEEAKVVAEKQTLRHEIIHAFLAESGLWQNSMSTDSWAMNEEMIDFFACQWPKIQAVFCKLGCENW